MVDDLLTVIFGLSVLLAYGNGFFKIGLSGENKLLGGLSGLNSGRRRRSSLSLLSLR